MTATAPVPPEPAHHIVVGGLKVEVVRKAIKNLHLGVYPPHGRVRVAAPLLVSDDAVRLFTVSRLVWIRRQQAKFQAQERQPAREYVSGESHHFQGRRYRLRVVEGGPWGVTLPTRTSMVLTVPPESTVAQREALLIGWYRAELKAQLPELVARWSERLGVLPPFWGVKRMKTKWGSCNREAGRIWINLELAKKAPHCLEYVVVHELAHLHERHHSARFKTLLNHHLPLWRAYRDELNAAPLPEEVWP